MSLSGKIKKIVEDVWAGESGQARKINDSDRFREDLHIKDVLFVTMVYDIEDEFDFDIPDEDSDKFKTVADLIKYVKKQMTESNGRQHCIKCGCTEADCSQCIEAQDEPCYWVAHGKCSRCFDKDGNPRKQNGGCFEGVL